MSNFYNKYPYTDFHELNLDWIIERVKELAAKWDLTEAQWIALRDYVTNYFANLDVQDEIDQKLEEMIADGTMDNIIRGILSNENGAYLALNRFCNFVQDSKRYSDPNTDDNYVYLQGGCSDGSSYVLAFVSIIDGNNGRTKLVKYDADMNIVTSNFVDVNHCNDMTYYDGKIYSTSYGQTGVTTYEKTVSIIDYNTLSLIDQIEPADITINRITLIDYYAAENKFYLCLGMNKVVVYDTAFSAIEKTIYLQFPFSNKPNAIQSIRIINNLIHVLAYPNTIYVFDMTGTLIKVYNIGRHNGVYVVGECETMFEWQGKQVIVSCQMAGFNSPLSYTQLFNFSMTSGVNNEINNTNQYFGYANFYADSSNTYSQNKNPDGSQTNPYPEAIICLLHCTTARGGKVIKIKGTHSMLSFDNLSNIDISRDGSTNPDIAGVRLSFATNIHFNNINFVAHSLTSQLNNACVYGNMSSNIIIENCSFDGNSALDNGALLTRTDGIINACTFTNFNSYGVRLTHANMMIVNSTSTPGDLAYVNGFSDFKYKSTTDQNIWNNSLTDVTNRIRIFNGSCYYGSLGLSDFYKNQLKSSSLKYNTGYVVLKIDLTNTRKEVIIPTSSGHLTISECVAYSGNWYITTIRLSTNNATTGDYEINNSYVYDMADNSVHTYADGGSYPFLSIEQVYVANE